MTSILTGIRGLLLTVACLLALAWTQAGLAATGDVPGLGGGNAPQILPESSLDDAGFGEPGGSDLTRVTVTIHRDPADLPEAAAKTRQDLMEAARSGDITRLGPIFARQTQPTQLSFDNVGDPVLFLRETSNDGAGRETLAILLELLEAPYAVYNEGTEAEFYTWPYLEALNLDTLEPEQLIDLYKIVSHQDLEEMRLFGAWFFFRVSISAKGEWLSYVAGD